MDTPPPPAPPHGSLIEVARKGAGLSMQRAAALAGISKATWIDNTRGYRKRGSAWQPVEPKPETIARMAHAVALRPGRLESEGEHPDAADILREILRREEESASAAAAAPPLRAVPSPPPVTTGSPAERERDRLLAEHPDDEILLMISRRRGIKVSQAVMEMLDWLGSQDPASWADNGTAG